MLSGNIDLGTIKLYGIKRKLNVNYKLNNQGVKNATAFGSITSLGELTFISKQTASSSATISFTSGIDSTYKEYIFILLIYTQQQMELIICLI